jgi:hypothetical protein
MKTMILAAALLALAAGTCGAVPSGEGSGCRMVWINGEVDRVDWVGSKFSIRLAGYDQIYYYGAYSPDSLPQFPSQLRFFVTRQTEFVGHTDSTTFSSLHQSDDVSVLFCKDDYRDPVAVRVVVNNAY